jgi:outer membrane protein assembly factor BamB
MKNTIVGLCTALLLHPSSLQATDWPQFMRTSQHTGDASDESLTLPLRLAAQIKLGDAIMTSPAVVGGLVYVVDQMGTAYCIEPASGRIVWKAAPDGAAAMGSNTSSPCVAKGRVYYGTTAGTLHILDAKDGKVVKTLNVGAPVVSAPTFANDSIYFQALDAILRCLDLDGNERWKWGHYARYQEPRELSKKLENERGHPGSYDRPHYGGGDVAVSGKRVLTSFGWDCACIEDAGSEAKLLWCNRAPTGRDGSSPMSSSISGDWVYNAGMGADGHLALTRLSLNDGQRAKDSANRQVPAWFTPAIRGTAVAFGKNSITLLDHAAGKALASWQDDTEPAAFATSHVLAKTHLVAVTLQGAVIVVDLEAKPGAKPFRFKTPNGKAIGSSPSIADNRIYFGCDDGYFYVLGPQGDPDLKPPLRVRWASRGYGHFLSPCIATEEDLISVTFRGLVTCQEQATGRMRWRVQLPGREIATSAGLLAANGKLFVPRPPYGSTEGAFFCLDLRDGRSLWSAEIGGRYIWERAAPVLAEGRVAFGSAQKGTPQGTLIQAWEADSGKPAWKVELNVAGNRSGSIGGCTDGKVMYFTAGAGSWQWKQEGDKQRGELVAIEAKTGKVLRRSKDVFGATYPVLAGDRLFLSDEGQLHCVAADDGKLLWKRALSGFSRFSVLDDFLVARGYGGHGAKLRLEDGKDYPNCKQLGGATHACGPVALTPNVAFAITVGGLNVREVKSGDLLWQSPGFAPRGCVNATLANGRVFFPTAASGMIYCWEPVAVGRGD